MTLKITIDVSEATRRAHHGMTAAGIGLTLDDPWLIGGVR